MPVRRPPLPAPLLRGGALTAGLLAAGPAARAAEVLRTDPDGAFDELRVDLGGFVQPRFVLEQKDEVAGHPGERGWEVRRARLELDTRWSTDGDKGKREEGFAVGARFGLEAIPEARLVDAYIDVQAARPLALRVGQFKAPTGRSWMVSDRRTLFPERGEITELYPGRQMGGMVFGSTRKNVIEYGVGLFNGEGTNRLTNVNEKFLSCGRVVISPFGGPGTEDGELLAIDVPPTVSVGYSAFLNVQGPEEQEDATIGHNAEVFAHWRWVSVQGEVLWRFTDWQDTTLADYNSGGFYAQIGSFVPGVPWAEEHLALMYKLQQLDELDAVEDWAPPTGPTDPAVARREHSLGLGWYAGGPHFGSIHTLRVQLEYTMRQEVEGAGGGLHPGAVADAPYQFDNDVLMLAGHLSF